MQQFNYQQKIAMMRILLDVIHADGKIDAREMFYFNELKKELEVPDDSQNDVEEKNSLLALVQIKLFDDEQKEFFSKLMSNMRPIKHQKIRQLSLQKQQLHQKRRIL